MPSSSSCASTRSIWAWSSGPAYTPSVPSNSPPSSKAVMTAPVWSVPASAVYHGACARSSVSGDIDPPMTAV